jgi:hypothetical protein
MGTLGVSIEEYFASWRMLLNSSGIQRARWNNFHEATRLLIILLIPVFMPPILFEAFCLFSLVPFTVHISIYEFVLFLFIFRDD